MKVVDDNNFKTEVLESDIPVLVDFYADWCGPCRIIAPVLERLSHAVDGVKFVKIDIDKSFNTAAEYGVRSIPTVMIFKGGEPVATRVGVMSEGTYKQWIQDSIK